MLCYSMQHLFGR